MPGCGGYEYGFWESNPRLWDKCKREVSNQMIAEGWPPKARKFDSVMRKRARKLFYNQ